MSVDRGLVAGRPDREELAVLVEDLHAAVLAIGNVDAAVPADADAVDREKLERSRLGRITGTFPQSSRNLPFGSNFATRVPA